MAILMPACRQAGLTPSGFHQQSKDTGASDD